MHSPGQVVCGKNKTNWPFSDGSFFVQSPSFIYSREGRAILPRISIALESDLREVQE